MCTCLCKINRQFFKTFNNSRTYESTVLEEKRFQECVDFCKENVNLWNHIQFLFSTVLIFKIENIFIFYRIKFPVQRV